jgi:riboflavin kinase/FMN adenylyltransferase
MQVSMLVINWQQFIEKGFSLEGKKTSMTVGVFDGVHRGHQVLIERVVSFNADYVPVVITFQITNNREQRNIQSFQERLSRFESLGIKITIVIDFTEEFRQMPGINFLEILLKYGNIGFFAVGNNFRCGYRLDTDAAAIQNFFASRNISVEIVPEVCHPADGLKGSQPVSSSRIRAAIAAGDITLAQAMLGY